MVIGVMALCAAVVFAVISGVKDRRLPSIYVTIHHADVRDTSYDTVKLVSYDGGKTNIPVSEHTEQYDITTDYGFFRTGSRRTAERFMVLPVCIETNQNLTLRSFPSPDRCAYAELK